MADYLKVTQVRSVVGRMGNQRQTLLGLGIKRRGRTAFVKDTPSARGMVRTVAHLVAWQEATAAEREAALAYRRPPSYEVISEETPAGAATDTDPEEGENA